MATAIQAYCLAQGCCQKVDSGYCALHQQQYRHSQNVEHDHRLYRQQAWRRFRQQVLSERVWCEDCGRLATEVHHKVKRGQDLTKFYDESNVSALCKPCHSKRTKAGQ
jgi:5-methylcytosine-specific restriction protein A